MLKIMGWSEAACAARAMISRTREWVAYAIWTPLARRASWRVCCGENGGSDTLERVCGGQRLIAFIALMIFAPIAVAQDIRYVKPGGGSPATGLSWATAYATINDALVDVDNGDAIEVRIAAGTYTPGTTAGSTFLFDDHKDPPVEWIRIRGGYAPTGNPNDPDLSQYETVLSGAVGGSTHALNVVTIYLSGGPAGTGIEFDGVSIKAGRATDEGGGIYENGSVRLSFLNARLTDNQAANRG